MIVSQALTLFSTPVIYLSLDRLRLRLARRRNPQQEAVPYHAENVEAQPLFALSRVPGRVR